jgi:glyoxylase-like metal-dependent hydrolase (beta-lactamase superfamily II)
VITPPTHLVRTRQQYRPGARRLELIPLSPGHTDTDLVVHVADADTVVGDLIEASGPPMFGSGCYPLEFPGSLRGLLSEIGPADTIIPGHGPLVDRSFAIAQLTDITYPRRVGRARRHAAPVCCARKPSGLRTLGRSDAEAPPRSLG